MPQDLNEFLPDTRTLLADSDRRAAEQKYQHALHEEEIAGTGGGSAGTSNDSAHSGGEAAAEQATASSGGTATENAATESVERAGRVHVVAEPPPATVPIAKPVPRAMPGWKKAALAVAAVVLPLVVLVVAWEWKNGGAESSGGDRWATPTPFSSVPALASVSATGAVPTVSAAAAAASATTTAEPAASTTPSVDATGPASARPKAAVPKPQPGTTAPSIATADPTAAPKDPIGPAPIYGAPKF